MSRTFTIRLLVALSKPLGWLVPLRNRSSLFFFFPFMHVGGAERVHGAVTDCVADRRPWVFFTKRSDNDRFRHLFPEDAKLFNVWFLFKYCYPVSVGIMAGFINRHRTPVVFGSNSLFYYLLLPHLRQEVRRLDLLHAFGGGTDRFSLPVAHLMDRRVVITPRTSQDLAAQYHANGIDPTLMQRVLLIENYVDLPAELPEKRLDEKLHLLYVGRGSKEKRVHLVGRIAARCAQGGLPVEVTLMGDATEAINPVDRAFCRLLGEVSERSLVAQQYDRSHILLVTSSREGFPMVIMEAMAHGVVTISTDVGGISQHVKNGVNGWLVDSTDDEERIVNDFCRIVTRLCNDRRQLHDMSRAAFAHAREHFGGDRFCSAYRSLLLGHEDVGADHA